MQIPHISEHIRKLKCFCPLPRRCYKDDLCALAFKVVHDKQRGPLVFLRIYSGCLKPQTAVHNINRNATYVVCPCLCLNSELISDLKLYGLRSIMRRERMSRLLVPFADQHVEIPSLTAGNIALTVGLKQVGAPHITRHVCFAFRRVIQDF